MTTKKTIILILILLNLQFIFAQKDICPIVKFDKDWSEEICLEYKGKSEFYSFKDNQEAINYVEQLMNLAGLPMNFIVSECSGIENAFAYNYDGIQYIFYGNEFLESLNSNSSEIGSITVLAHEIGHHLSGHTSANSYINRYCDDLPCAEQSQDCLDALEIRRIRELQADRFAGFIMYKFGASLEDTQDAFRKLLNNQEYDDTCSTHPSLSKRLESTKIGFYKAKELENKTEDTIPTEQEKLEDIKGDKIEFEVSDKSRIERNRLVNEIKEMVIRDIRTEIITNSEYRLENSAADYDYKLIHPKVYKYLGYKPDKYQEINTEKEYFAFNIASLKFKDDNRINYGPILGYHAKNGVFNIIQFTDNSTKIIYSTISDQNNIDRNELKKVLIDNFKDGLQRELNKHK